MNVVVDDLRENQYCKNIVVIHQLQILKPGSDRISVDLQNLTSRTLKLKKGANVSHVETSQIVPVFDNPLEKGDVCKEVTKDVTKESQSRDSLKSEDERMSKILEK